MPIFHSCIRLIDISQTRGHDEECPKQDPGVDCWQVGEYVEGVLVLSTEEDAVVEQKHLQGVGWMGYASPQYTNSTIPDCLGNVSSELVRLWVVIGGVLEGKIPSLWIRMIKRNFLLLVGN